VKPILLPMILGQETRLSTAHQATLALWVAKTAMVFDRSYPPDRQFIPSEQLRFVRQHNQPPPETVIWLAAYGLKNRIASHVSFRLPRLGSNVPGSRGVPPNGHGTTISVGHFVAQMLNDPGSEHRTFEVLRQSRDFVVQIWPTRQARLTWPPRYALDDDGLDALGFPQ
jgi:hypothetical protein